MATTGNNEFLNNTNLDFTEQERQEKYKHSSKNALLFNIIGPVVFVLMWIL
ncbi:MAG TPA: hypothetical protein VGC01_11975 [Mucilaginibacter sp.]